MHVAARTLPLLPFMLVLRPAVFRLYKERLSQVDIKLQEVMAGCAQEYLEPLANLQENMQIRTKVAGGWFGGGSG